jgi:ATP citrate (pro-S)-lyase
MSAKAIREYHGKRLVSKWLPDFSQGAHDVEDRFVQVTAATLADADGLKCLEQEHPWLLTTPLVVKPDQLIKRRGKAGLLAVNKDWEFVQEWIHARMGTEQKVEVVTGTCTHHCSTQNAVQ